MQQLIICIQMVLIIYNKHSKYLQIHFSNQILTIPINQLQTIFHSSNDNTLPFNIRDFSQWLLENSNPIRSKSRWSYSISI